MTDLTPLDTAHAAMQAAPDDDAARLRFYETLAASELYLMIKSDPGHDAETVAPEVIAVDEAQYVLVFDREERLSAFASKAAPYVALSGRSIAQMLQGERIGLGVNLEVAPSAILLPESAITWLHETLGNAPDEVEARIAQVFPPAGLPENLIAALDAKLATAMGLAQSAYLVAVAFDTGARGHLLGFVGAVPQAEAALAQAASDALTFSAIEAGAMDIGFFAPHDPLVEKMNRVGLRFDLPQLQETVTQERPAPGMDPENPPKLK